MECHYCHTNTRKFLCRRCVKDRLDTHDTELAPLEAERDKLVEEASQFVKSSSYVRELWSEKHKCTATIEHATAEQRRINQECESARRRMQQLRIEIEKRRSRLENVDRGHIEAAMADCTKEIQQVKKRWHRVHKLTVSARRVLVQEIVSLFDFKPGVVEDSPIVDPRSVSSSPSPSSSSPSLPFAQKHRPSPQQNSQQQQPEDLYICGVTLPARVIDVSRYPKDELNAAISYLIHMLGLIVRYLGVKLPFPIVYRTMYPYVRSTLSKERPTNSKMPLFLDDKNLRRFAIGMAMLNYDIAYLCHSQGVEIPVSQVVNPLQALMACCRSPRLGMRSHVSMYQGIRSTDFQLEFQQVLKMTTNRYRSGSPINTELNRELVLNGLLQSNPADEWYYYDGFLDNSEDDIQDDEEEDDDGGVSSENWNLVDVMPSFGRPNGDGESIFQLGATIMPGVIGMSRNVIGNMMASGSSQDNHHSSGEQQETQAQQQQLFQQYPYYYRRLSAAVKRNSLRFRPLI
ncbi:UV radiation resistance protein and autophagy-related subunit 14-domain-containing protein [Fennellomyces sp. T-0311]|nr:UV radiation resistance protein and autophagy-related subunit 14-domain-containing protein [Fennellomyces sp. T-0311]